MYLRIPWELVYWSVLNGAVSDLRCTRVVTDMLQTVQWVNAKQSTDTQEPAAAAIQYTFLLFLRFVSVSTAFTAPFFSISYVVPCPRPPSSSYFITQKTHRLTVIPTECFIISLRFCYIEDSFKHQRLALVFRVNILYENNEMEECLHYTFFYTCASIGENI